MRGRGWGGRILGVVIGWVYGRGSEGLESYSISLFGDTGVCIHYFLKSAKLSMDILYAPVSALYFTVK